MVAILSCIVVQEVDHSTFRYTYIRAGHDLSVPGVPYLSRSPLEVKGHRQSGNSRMKDGIISSIELSVVSSIIEASHVECVNTPQSFLSKLNPVC